MNGIKPGQVVRVVQTEAIGDQAITVYFRTADGKLDERLLFRADEPSLSLAHAGRPWAFDAYPSTAVNRDDRRKIQESFRNDPDVLLLVAADADLTARRRKRVRRRQKVKGRKRNLLADLLTCC